MITLYVYSEKGKRNNLSKKKKFTVTDKRKEQSKIQNPKLNQDQKLKISLSALNNAQKNAIKIIKDNDLTILHGAPGTGKASAIDAKVYTPTGPVLMKDIRIGDVVCTPNGKTSSVIGVFPQGTIDIYRISFSDGTSTEVSGDHLWEVSDIRSAGSRRIISTIQILNSYKDKFGRSKYCIPITNDVYFEHKDVHINPYVLGCLLGDGSMTLAEPRLTSADEDILVEVGSNLDQDYILKKCHRKYDYRLSRKLPRKIKKENNYTSLLKKYNLHGKLSYQKFIPKDYIYNSVDVRLAVLQGLMDTDGYVEKSGSPYFCTTSKQLADDVSEIVQSLGGLVRRRQRITTYSYKGKKKFGRLSYSVLIQMNDHSRIFKLKRKKEKLGLRNKYKVKRIISNIEKIDKKEAKCILLNDTDHLYLTDYFIVTHNTHLATIFGLQQLIWGNYQKLIITRPCIEACGESLGFLPGDFNAKIAPYLIPIWDILLESLRKTDLNLLIEEGKIVTIPLAYHRGITFKNAFVIADEMQNTLPQQMRMFLTRMGMGSKVVITGDVSQSDIRNKNGLSDIIERLDNLENVGIVEMDRTCIVRHPLVASIEDRYSLE